MAPGHSQIMMAVSMRVGSSHDNCRLVMNEQAPHRPPPHPSVYNSAHVSATLLLPTTLISHQPLSENTQLLTMLIAHESYLYSTQPHTLLHLHGYLSHCTPYHDDLSIDHQHPSVSLDPHQLGLLCQLGLLILIFTATQLIKSVCAPTSFPLILIGHHRQ
jgi:hypothetical protein